MVEDIVVKCTHYGNQSLGQGLVKLRPDSIDDLRSDPVCQLPNLKIGESLQDLLGVVERLSMS